LKCGVEKKVKDGGTEKRKFVGTSRKSLGRGGGDDKVFLIKKEKRRREIWTKKTGVHSPRQNRTYRTGGRKKFGAGNRESKGK